MLSIGISGYIQQLKNEGDSIEVMDADEDAEMERLALITIEALCLPPREYNVLRRAEYKTVSDIIKEGPASLRKKRNCGAITYTTILDALERCGANIDGWHQYIEKKPWR